MMAQQIYLEAGMELHSMSSKNPRAQYIYCGNHTLDLALHDCVKKAN